MRPLTKRQDQVLALIADGKLNKEIAAELHIAENTVKNHVWQLMRHYDVTNRTQLAVKYVTQGRANGLYSFLANGLKRFRTLSTVR